MSLSRMGASTFRSQRRRHQRSPLSSRWRETLSARAWLPAWRIRAAISPERRRKMPTLTGKRFELLREIVPNLRRLAVLFNGNNPAYRLETDIVRAAAIPLGLEVLAAEIRSGDDIAPTFAAIATNADALLVVGEPLTFTYRSQISALALAARLPTTYYTRGYVEAGGLMSYGPNFPALFRRMADYVNKILRGTKPEDLPVEQPTRYDLIVNLTTAKALGLKIPESFLLRADEVIE